MAYGLKYIREFTNVQDQLCTLEFYAKDYTGAVQSVLGSRDSFVLSKELDDPFAPVQAQPANVELLSDEQMSFSVDDFYSEDDEYWLVKFYVTPPGGITRTEFYTGIESDVEYFHSPTANTIYLPHITVSAGISIGQQIFLQNKYYTIAYIEYSGTSGGIILHVNEPVVTGSAFDIDFIIYNITVKTLYYTGFVLQDETADAFISYDHFIHLTLTDNLGLLSDVKFDVACGELDPYQSFTIAEYLKIILSATGLLLPIQIFANIYEITTITRAGDATATFADQTRLFSGCFADDNGAWQSCFDILTSLMQAFNCIICQRKGAWVVYRWGELRTLNNTSFPGTQFNYDLTGKMAVSLPNTPVTITESGKNYLTGGADNKLYNTRPYKYVKETFTYNQPAEFIKNLDLQQLGDLRGTTTEVRDGETITIKEYDAPYWYLDPVSATLATNDYFIRVETDSNNVEITRYLVTTTDLGNGLDYVTVSDGAYVNKGDKITIDISARVPSDPGSSSYSYYITLYDGITRYWLSRNNSGFQDGYWKPGTEVPIRSDANPSGSDYKDWHSWGIDSLQIPIDGWLNIRLGVLDSNGNETNWKDIRLTYQPFINESTLITGQTHTQTQDGTIKNNNESDRQLDDSPRNLIAGTLLTDELTTFSQGNTNFWYPNPAADYVTKTKFWKRQTGEEKRLGQITSSELKQVYTQLRYKLDCSFNWKDDIDLLTTFQLPVLGNANFRMSMISAINFADCTCKCVLVEAWKSGEGPAVLNYEFKYLYQKS